MLGAIFNTPEEIPNVLGPNDVGRLLPGTMLQSYTNFAAIDHDRIPSWHPMAKYEVVKGPELEEVPVNLETRLGRNAQFIVLKYRLDNPLAKDRDPTTSDQVNLPQSRYLAYIGIVPYIDGSYDPMCRMALLSNAKQGLHF